MAWSSVSKAGGESADPQGGHLRVARSAQLLMGVKDTDGEPLKVAPTEKVEVVSKELGSGIYDVTGDPEPLRKKRRVIGYSVTLVRVEEDEFTRASA